MGQNNEKMRKNSIYDIDNDVYKNRYTNFNYNNNNNDIKNVMSNYSNIKILDDEDNIPLNKSRGSKFYKIPSNIEKNNSGNLSNKYYGNTREHNPFYIDEMKRINKDHYYNDNSRNINNNVNGENTRFLNTYGDSHLLNKDNMYNRINGILPISYKINKGNIYDQQKEEYSTKKHYDFKNGDEHTVYINNNNNINNNHFNNLNKIFNENNNNNNYNNNYNKNRMINIHHLKTDNNFQNEWNNKKDDRYESMYNDYNNRQIGRESQIPLSMSKRKLNDIDHIIKKYTSKENIEETKKGNYFYTDNEALYDILKNSDNEFYNKGMIFDTDNNINFKQKTKDREYNEKKKEDKINVLKNIIVTNPNKQCNLSFNDDLYDSMLIGNENYLNQSNSSLFDYNVGNIYNNIIHNNNSNNKMKKIYTENKAHQEWNSVDKMNETPNPNTNNKNNHIMLGYPYIENNVMYDNQFIQHIPNSIEKKWQINNEEQTNDKMKSYTPFLKNRDHNQMFINTDNYNPNQLNNFQQKETGMNEYVTNTNNKYLYKIHNDNQTICNNISYNPVRNKKVENDPGNIETEDINKYNYYNKFNRLEKNEHIYDKHNFTIQNDTNNMENQRYFEKSNNPNIVGFQFNKNSPFSSPFVHKNQFNDLDNRHLNIFKNFSDINNDNINENNQKGKNNNMLRKRFFYENNDANENINNIIDKDKDNINIYKKCFKANENETATISYTNRNNGINTLIEGTDTIFDNIGNITNPQEKWNNRNNINKLNNANYHKPIISEDKMFNTYQNEKGNTTNQEENIIRQTAMFENNSQMNTFNNRIGIFKNNIREASISPNPNDNFNNELSYLQKNKIRSNDISNDISNNRNKSIYANNSIPAPTLSPNISPDNVNNFDDKCNKFMKKYYLGHNTDYERDITDMNKITNNNIHDLNHNLKNAYIFNNYKNMNTNLKPLADNRRNEINKRDSIINVNMKNKQMGLDKDIEIQTKENYKNIYKKLNNTENDFVIKEETQQSPFNYAINEKNFKEKFKENKNIYQNNANILNNFNNNEYNNINNIVNNYSNDMITKENIFLNTEANVMNTNTNNNGNINRKSIFHDYENISKNMYNHFINTDNRRKGITDSVPTSHMDMHDNKNTMNPMNICNLNNISNIGIGGKEREREREREIDKQLVNNLHNNMNTLNNRGIKQTVNKTLPPLPFKNFGKNKNDLFLDNNIKKELFDNTNKNKKEENYINHPNHISELKKLNYHNENSIFSNFNFNVTNNKHTNNVKGNRNRYGSNMYEEEEEMNEEINNIGGLYKNKQEKSIYSTTENYKNNIYGGKTNINTHNTFNNIGSTLFKKKKEESEFKDPYIFNDMINESLNVFKNQDMLNKKEGSRLVPISRNGYTEDKTYKSFMNQNVFSEENKINEHNYRLMKNNNINNLKDRTNVYAFKSNNLQDERSALNSKPYIPMQTQMHIQTQEEDNSIFNKNRNSVHRTNLNNSKNKENSLSLNNNISMILDKFSDLSSDKKKKGYWTSNLNMNKINVNNFYTNNNSNIHNINGKNINNRNIKENYDTENQLNNTENENMFCVNTENYNDNLNIDTKNFALSDNYVCHFGLSTLYRGKLKNENYSFLINIINSFYLSNAKGNDIVANNILFHKRLRHINILAYLGKTADQNKLYLVFENVQGNILKSYSTPFEENIIASYAFQLLDLLEYMHSNFIIFHGLMSNIIILQKNTREELIQILNEKGKNVNKCFDIYKHGIIKIFNFDFANMNGSDKDYEFDFFCVAVLIHEMCTKFQIYPNNFDDIVTKMHSTNFFFPQFVSPELRSFCFELCSKKNHSFSTLKNHIWFKKNFNF